MHLRRRVSSVRALASRPPFEIGDKSPSLDRIRARKRLFACRQITWAFCQVLTTIDSPCTSPVKPLPTAICIPASRLSAYLVSLHVVTYQCAKHGAYASQIDILYKRAPARGTQWSFIATILRPSSFTFDLSTEKLYYASYIQKERQS